MKRFDDLDLSYGADMLNLSLKVKNKREVLPRILLSIIEGNTNTIFEAVGFIENLKMNLIMRNINANEFIDILKKRFKNRGD